MLKSMTAYGSGRCFTPEGGNWHVELRTINSKFFDPYLRLPSSISGLEDRIKKYLHRQFIRGRIILTITASGNISISPRLVLNLELVKEYNRIFKELKHELGIEAKLDLVSFLFNNDIVNEEEKFFNLDTLWLTLEPALVRALDEAKAMRIVEGNILSKYFFERLDKLVECVNEIGNRSFNIIEKYRLRLQKRISKLVRNVKLDPQRIAMEVAIIADRCDITEEVTRIISHLEQFRFFLQSEKPVGRKLDFLIQELNREINTIGNKSIDVYTVKLIVDIKADLERMREQIQNIE